MMTTEDESAIADIMNFKRLKNAFRSCCHYLITETSEDNIYYISHTEYNFDRSSLQHENLHEIIHLLTEVNFPEHCKQYEINQVSILLELESLHFL